MQPPPACHAAAAQLARQVLFGDARGQHEQDAEQARSAPTQPPVFPQELIERVAHYVRQQVRQGQTLMRCSQELGVPRARLHDWVYQRARPAVLAPERSLLRPVQVSSQIVHVPDGVPERRYILRSPAGWGLADLRLPELVELLRSLP